jgi:hypothetical protein
MLVCLGYDWLVPSPNARGDEGIDVLHPTSGAVDSVCSAYVPVIPLCNGDLQVLGCCACVCSKG